MGDTAPVELASASSVLVLTGDEHPGGADSVYADLLANAVGDGGAVLLVTFGEAPDERISDIRAVGGTLEELRVVAVGESIRSVAVTDGPGTSPMETVERSDSLTELATRVVRAFDDWQHRENVVVCFDSLTDLLDRTSLEETFRVLHVLINHLETAGATGFFQLDSDAHDPETVATLQPLFDDTCHQLDHELETVRTLVGQYFGSLLTDVAESSPVSRSELVMALARLHRTARAQGLQDQADVDVVHRDAAEAVLAIPAEHWQALAAGELDLRQRQAARECHRRMAAALGETLEDPRDPFVYPY